MLEMMLGMAMRSISLLMFITEGKDKNKMKYLGVKVEHMCRFGDFLAGLGLKIGDFVKEKLDITYTLCIFARDVIVQLQEIINLNQP